MNYLPVIFYCCPECEAQWAEFKDGLHTCSECGVVLKFWEEAGPDDPLLCVRSMVKDVPEGCLFTLDEVGL